MIEVRFADEPSPGMRSIDGRGRLQLPQGLMRAVGIEPGDRVAIIRRVDRDGFALVPVDSLGVRRGPA